MGCVLSTAGGVNENNAGDHLRENMSLILHYWYETAGCTEACI